MDKIVENLEKTKQYFDIVNNQMTESIVDRDDALIDAINECMSLDISFADFEGEKDKLVSLAKTLNNLKLLEEVILSENEQDRENIEDELGIDNVNSRKKFEKEIMKKLETEEMPSKENKIIEKSEYLSNSDNS